MTLLQTGRLLLCFFLLPCSFLRAQTVAAPAVWYSFDGSMVPYLQADLGLGDASSQGTNPVSRIADRFGVLQKAISFESGRQSTIVTYRLPDKDTYNSKLFGLSDGSTDLPVRFTISCWVYADPSEDNMYHKIFYAGGYNSPFALIYKGKDIFLRRRALNSVTSDYQLFDYFFGSPATFDAGAGWYHVTLVMGRQASDQASFSKLFIGKPLRVKYDGTGPRTLPANAPNDVLATNFGGAFAFTGVQSVMNTAIGGWGMGNLDGNDADYHSNVAPVKRIDDFCVWDSALNEMQVYSFFKCTAISPVTSCWSYPGSRMAVPEPLVIGDSVKGEVPGITEPIVYPNPGNGELWVKLPAAYLAADPSIILSDMEGHILHRRDHITVDSGEVIRLGDLKKFTRSTGFYLLTITAGSQRKTFKIIIH